MSLINQDDIQRIAAACAQLIGKDPLIQIPYQERLYDKSDTARILGVSENTTWILLKAGALKGVPISKRQTLFTWDDIQNCKQLLIDGFTTSEIYREIYGYVPVDERKAG